MARSSRGGGGGFGRSKPTAAPARSSVPAARPVAPAPAPMQQQQPAGGGMMAGLASTVAQGMAFGTGSAIAHRAVGAIAGSFGGGSDSDSSPAVEQQQQPMQQVNGAVCGLEKQNMYECMQQNKNDQQACTFLYQMLNDCQRNQQMFN